ncbi:hypothetical protein [uncultured Aquimarina sp.]|nr:hypothetical protein [uncultured Aquimarina sp.]
MLQRTINPEEGHLFYIVLLIHAPDNDTIRAGFILKEHDLSIKIT